MKYLTLFVFLQTLFFTACGSNSRLHDALASSDFEMAKKLIEDGADLDYINPADGDTKGMAPIHIAALSGNLEVMKLLLAKGANPNAYEATIGFTAMHVAAQMGFPEIIGALASHKGDVNAMSLSNKVAPIHTAIAFNNKNGVVSALLKAGADVNLQTQEGKLTPLMLAVIYTNMSVVKLVIDYKPNLEMENSDHATALMIAAKNGLYDIAKYIMAAGASQYQFLASLNYSSDEAEKGKNLTIAKRIFPGKDIFKRNKDLSDLLHISVKQDNMGMLAWLLECGLNVNSLDYDGKTPLHRAVESESLVMVKFLVSKGANVNKTVGDKPGLEETPLAISRDIQDEAIKKSIRSFLISKGGKEKQPVVEVPQETSVKAEEPEKPAEAGIDTTFTPSGVWYHVNTETGQIVRSLRWGFRNGVLHNVLDGKIVNTATYKFTHKGGKIFSLRYKWANQSEWLSQDFMLDEERSRRSLISDSIFLTQPK